MKHLLTAIACFFALSMSAQTWNPDADFDNVIGVNDLMALLSVFGGEWTAEYPQDPEYDLAAYYAGSMGHFECVRTCVNNNAQIIRLNEYAIFQDSVEVITGGQNEFHLGEGRFYKASYYYTGERLTLSEKGIIYFYDAECFCTGLVPVVE